MKLYLYIRTSNGEEAASLDLIKIFKDEKSVKDFFEKDKKEILSTLEEYYFTNRRESKDQWEISVEDYESPSGETTFRGFIETQEID